jgi:crotonobetainyl-CoA:carnitine CoA-transferase CaiB-like acyl-CoA transferase
VLGRLRAAFEGRNAAELEASLNAAGVPAARVRKLGEFLREVDDTDCVKLPDFRFSQGTQEVRTRGLGFSFAQEGEPSGRGAEALGHSTHALLTEMGLEADTIAALGRAGVLRYAA